MKRILRDAALSTLPQVGKKAWERLKPVRERGVKALKSIPGHIRDIQREKREAEK